MRRSVLVAGLVVLGGCALGGRAAALPELPEDPCKLLSAEEVSAVTGLQVAEGRREQGIGSSADGRAPGPGTICVYDTGGDFGAIQVIVPPPGERRTEAWRAAREAYFRQFPGSAAAVPGLGEDAWFAAGSTLHVLARDGVHFTLATRMAQPRSRELLTALARAVLGRL